MKLCAMKNTGYRAVEAIGALSGEPTYSAPPIVLSAEPTYNAPPAVLSGEPAYGVRVRAEVMFGDDCYED